MATSTSSFSNASIIVAAAFALGSALVAEIINKTVSEPYLDEIFHIPQAQAYCESKWDQWDPKLTTPPGLYLFSISIHKILPSNLTKGLGPCSSVSFLRTTNLFLLMILPHIISSLLDSVASEVKGNKTKKPPSYIESMTSDSKDSSTDVKPLSIPKNPGREVTKALQKAELKPLESSKDARRSVSNKLKSKGIKSETSNLKRTLQSHIITSLPPLYFFGFLYYTDVGSLVMVLSSLLVAKKENHLLAAILGGLSLFFRQTNIIWLAFIASISIVKKLKSNCGFYDPILSQTSSKESYLKTLSKSIYSSFSVLQNFDSLKVILKILIPYTPIFIAFVAFLKWNEGIVLGDKSNHQPIIHLTQLFYFTIFSTFFSFPTLLQTLNLTILKPISIIKFIQKSLFSTKFKTLNSIFYLILILISIHFKTFEHAFLLADNRHYTFYVWRKIIKFNPLMKYLLSPIYLITGLFWFKALSKTTSLIWILGHFVSISLTLIPSPLIEPRYFLIPFTIMRIQLKSNFEDAEENEDGMENEGLEVDGSEKSEEKNGWMDLLPLVGEGLWYLSINTITIYVFLHKPFKWQSEDGWQRFMW